MKGTPKLTTLSIRFYNKIKNQEKKEKQKRERESEREGERNGGTQKGDKNNAVQDVFLLYP